MARRETLGRVEEEIRREKAEALGRVGERLTELLGQLRDLGRRIDDLERARAGGGDPEGAARLEAEIERFNRLREGAARLVHDLIIQREAVGFRRHTLILQSYPIPPRRSLAASPRPEEPR